MQSHHAVDPVLVQPHVPDPHLLRHQLFRCVLIRLPHCCLHSSPSCLHSSPTCFIPSWTPPIPTPSCSGSSSRSSDRTRFFCPHQPFQLVPTPTRCPPVLVLWGSFLTPVCLYILVPLSQSQGAVPQDTEGRWRMGPAIPSCSSRGRPCPLSSPSPQWVHLTIYESPHLSFNLSQHQGIFQWGKDWRREEKGTTEDEMVGWHHWLDGHEFEQALRVGEEREARLLQSMGSKESDTTEQLYWTTPPKLWMQEGASAQLVLSQNPCTCCVFFQDISPDSLRAPVSPHQGPLAFPSEHRSQCNSVFSTLTQRVPLYTVQSTDFHLDVWVCPLHLGQCLAPQQTSADWINGGGNSVCLICIPFTMGCVPS